MELLELPLEVLREILHHAVSARAVFGRDVKRGLRLRLVNRLFSQEVTKVLFESNTLREHIRHGRVTQSTSAKEFWQNFLTHRIMGRKENINNTRLGALKQVAEVLCNETGKHDDPETMREYVFKMCFRAAERNELSLSKLMETPFKANYTMGMRCLLRAAILNQCPEVVEKILQAPETPDDILYDTWDNIMQQRPAYIAGESGNLDIIKSVLSSRFWNMQEKREQALMGAIAGGHLDAVAFILKPQWGPLNFISSAGTVEVPLLSGILASPYVDFYTQLYALISSFASGQYPVHLFEPEPDELLDDICGASTQREDIAAYIIEMGVEIKRTYTYTMNRTGRLIPGSTERQTESHRPYNHLRRAVIAGNEKIVGLLLAKGADPNQVDDDLLWYAARIGRMDIVRMLVEVGGADVNRVPKLPYGAKMVKLPDRCVERECKPFVLAVGLEHEEMCRYLLDHGTELDPETATQAMQTALYDELDTMVGFLEERGVSREVERRVRESSDLDSPSP
ncbi:ankyrin [Amniculicola lignicola CBS 123094]|uniref:Ankyrin n=1 Tax=Amniculicola lignicola CBS 123094 TaxID=1392246 RepID=A0A6A5WPU9_9PLEO|nr:ankyrin [Amniculicola lignicola CBS 123094]